MTMGVLDVLRQVRFGVVAGNPAVAEELVELHAAHPCQNAGFSQGEDASAVQGQRELPPDLILQPLPEEA